MFNHINISLVPETLFGMYLYRNKDYLKSEKIFKKLVKKQPENAYLNFRYGMCLYKESNWDDAHIYLTKAMGIDPSRESWKVQLATTKKYMINNTPANVAKSKDAVAKNPNSPDSIWKYATDLFNHKQFWMAKIQLEKYLELKPYAEKAIYKMGDLHEKLTNHQEAVKYFGQVSEYDPLNINYKYRLGYNYEKLGDEENADLFYKLLISLSREDSDVCRFGVGTLHAKRGLWIDAKIAYQKHKQEHPEIKDPDFFYRLGVAFDRCYEWNDAARTFEQAIKYSEKYHAHWCFKTAQAYERAEDYQKAAEFYQEAVERSSNYQDYWYFRLGYVLEKLGEHKRAASYFLESRRRKYPHAISPKDAIKNKEEDYLTYYAEYYETLEINPNLVMIESFFGSSISCNPYAILSYLLKNNYPYKYVVVAQDNAVIPDNLKFNRNIIFVKRGSDLFLRYLCSAKYLINNVSFPFYFIRKEEQIYVNTWHGTPMKTLGKDIKKPFLDHSNVARNFLHATHLISPNRHTTDVMLDKYDVKDMFSGKLAETGYPRVDSTINLSNERKIAIYKQLNLDINKPTVFYAPTWRGTSQGKDFDVKKLQKDLKYLTSNKYNFVFRGHHLVEELLKDIQLDVIVADKDIDSNELLGISDLLITDYSSIVYDFIATGKPVISYVYDFDEYNNERGLYFKKEEFLGSICDSIQEVKKAILAKIKSAQSNVSITNIKKFAPFDDGKATKRAINFIFHNDNSNVYQYERKALNAFFEGPFIPNGISRSFMNLMSKIKDAKTLPVILVNGNDIASSPKRLEEFDYLPKNIPVLSRVGRTPMTLEELWVKSKFDNNFQFISKSKQQTLIHIYKREARRMLGDTKFVNAINFEGYSLFWVLLFSQINASQHLIYQHNDKYKEWKSRFPYLQGVFNVYQYYDKIISVSEKTMENNIKNLANLYHIPKNKFVFCNNTINADGIIEKSKENINFEKAFKDFKGTKFINMGRMSHEKDQIKLIKAFAKVHQHNKDTRLFILGDGALRHDIEQKILELSLDKAVYLLGQKSNPFPYLKYADVFVLSSNHEGQPMVLLESLTLGLPIIATDIVGNRSILGDKYGMLVENSEQGLTEGMLMYLNGKYQNSEKFDADIYVEEAVNKFKELTRR